MQNQLSKLSFCSQSSRTHCTISDYGWGCAWRCIQMALSPKIAQTKAGAIDFPSYPLHYLFHEFGSRKRLEELYRKMRGLSSTPEYLKASSFPPFEQIAGWAEPFIGQLVLYRYSVPTRLLAINAIPKSANAPPEVFSGDCVPFQEFVSIAKRHFAGSPPEHAFPIMLDDSFSTFCVIGIGDVIDKEKLIVIWIGDPHVMGHAKDGVGIYTVYLKEDGTQVRTSVKEEDRQCMMGKGGDKAIYFAGKPWMALVGI